MSSFDLESRVIQITADQLGISDEDITLTSSFSSDLGADSLDIVELILALEEEFETEIPDDTIKKVKSVGELIKYLELETH
ncbi:MAG: acyl carrier protein [Deltaproteobacteria bacterium CG_4_10_14_0_2_um_filter_43_8]|nr:MAG: acyl carrier protein [Deltaproteobacteria bacterium CG11_big_fil_rev_8_21_14_0_20_42_23]PJA22321.1 MAG: acyl carrier protein [Deltaproteobacteria bacterium CG_4_10_14_0_2_um_filter_43_8]PJC64279.1 MAG: acyl carrier protein [Deltaproteobacteria bacterium CG_4_9_14_0_2_um_filter_42_21]